MPGAGHALEQALAYYRAPALLAMAAQRPLPEDVIVLLRLAAGDRAQAAQSAEASGESPERVAEAAVFFVQQVMFAANADPHRVLGVNPDAPPARIREHYRWLVRWLHPDRNADDWDNVYADRVTRAWQQLRRSGALAGEGEGEVEPIERRATPRDEAPAAKPSVLAATRLAHVSREQPAAPMISARTARQLPAFVLGGLGLAAVSLVALLWYAQQKPPRTPSLATPPVGGTSVPIASPESAPLADPPASSDAPLTAAFPNAEVLAPTSTPTPQSLGTEVPPTEFAPGAAIGQPVVATSPRAPQPPPVTATPPVGGTSVPMAAPQPTSPQTPSRARPVDIAAAPALVPAEAVAATTVESFGTEVPPTGGAGVEAKIEEGAAHAVLDDFTRAYAAGDINALMRLFTRDAINNRGGREAIAYDYQALFEDTRERRLALMPNGWIARDDGAVVLAAYEAWTKEGRLRPGTTTRGDIRFTLRREDGRLKISQVIHD
ncbi:DnaJ domain-containing protein [Arenimonas sp.]|uniref:DnaJ domain-containing protein n=1 Tax=Arenimonas sp. TaxID=1872635 RepID=UPI002E3297BD|nr:DnaJ domain-containing protein [Arenimonas sp.]HEX4854367.1 DnaJ domain-containing protein [Arenimonas sp.]